MYITIIHPSRRRPLEAYNTFKSWLSNTSDKIRLRYILSLDNSDPLLLVYRNFFDDTGIEIIYSDNQSAIDAVNNASKICLGGTIMVQISDDFKCFPNWDSVLESACHGNNNFVLKTFDGVQKWIVTLPIMDHTYYINQGYFYFPEYKHMFADTDLTHVADIQGKLIIRNDITFIHNHYSTGGQKKDDVNIKADSTWSQGESLYLKRLLNNFDLPPSIDIMNLSVEANAHKNWLTNKLNNLRNI